MTEREIATTLRAKYAGCPSLQPRAKRMSKLRCRFKGPALDREIERTREKLDLLEQIKGRGK